MKSLHKWQFPDKRVFLHRLEYTLLVLLTIIVLVFSFFIYGQQLFPTVIATLGFVLIYLLVAKIIKSWYTYEEHYHLTDNSLTITFKTKGKIKEKKKVNFKDIKRYKIDHFFKGGRIDTHKGERHSLWFNTSAEINKLEKVLKKKIKKK
jgi:hypothetical protein